MRLDRLSSLPKEAIDEILMHLPIRDAIKSSILSTNWRYKWNSIPQLVFNNDSILSTNNTIDLVKFVDCALLLHNGVISKFTLNDFLNTYSCDVDRWIVILSRKGLQNLTLSFEDGKQLYKVPGSLFNCETLRILRLYRCVLNFLPASFNGFSYLTDLELVNVSLTNETFENLVVKLPVLGTLKVVSCQTLYDINVRAPNLKAVYLHGIFFTINFHDSSNLVYLYLSPGWCLMQSFEGIISGLRELQVVDVTYPRIKNLALDTIYHHLTCAIFRINFKDPIQLLSVLFLCRCSPCLEKLQVVETPYSSFGLTFVEEEHFWNKRIHKEDVFHRLKSVRLDGFAGMDSQLGLAQFILMNALDLETLNISWKHGILNDSEKLCAVVKITKFERASSKAKVFFL